MKLATFDVSQHPFLYIRFHNVDVTDENFEEYKREYLEILLQCKKQNHQLISIIDVNHLSNLSIPYMIKQSGLNRELYSIHQKYLIAVFIYCESKIFKELIKMHMFVEKPAVPLQICRSIEKLNRAVCDKTNLSFDSQTFILSSNR